MLRRFIQRLAANIHTRPKTFIIVSLAALFLGWYAVWFFVPRQVTFAYSGDTCANTPTLLPGLQSTVGSPAFDISYKGGFSIGGVKLLATQVCFTPHSAPVPGTTTLAAAPWGTVFFRTHYTIQVDDAPVVKTGDTVRTLAATKPLTYAISQDDRTFTYAVTSEGKSAVCSVGNKTISCGLSALKLVQGTTYDIALTRSFKGSDPKELVSSAVSLLPAVTVTGSSPQAQQTVYDKISSLTVTTDKKLSRASAQLVRVDGDTRTPVDVTANMQDTTVTIAAAGELEREKTFELRLTSAEAVDGSTLAEPYSLSFTTSGGPKVQKVSIGSSNVDPNARIVVTLDQAIADSVDITKFARASGVSAVVSRQGSQVTFALAGAPRCTAFTLTLDKGITSGTNGLASRDSWSYSSRVNCRATAIIGYSVKGRPIIAYYYGSGSSTVMFTGGMHGSEPSGYLTMQAWAAHLDTYAYNIPAGKQVVIVPNTNPDGIAAGSRYNANGVNIDRNFATGDWQTDIDTADGHKPGGGGSAPASEPETKALAALTAQLRPQIEVSFHAQGRLVGANQVGNSASIGAAYARTVGYTTMYGNAEELMGYTITGEYETWIGEKLGLPAILIELPSVNGNYFNAHRNALWQVVNS